MRRDQGPGVGIARRIEHLGNGAGLAQVAALQHDHPVRELCHQREVVRDVDRGRAVLAQHVADRAQHLDLRGHVERGGRLVEDHEVGIGDQRHRRHDPLQLAAGDLVRIAAADVLRIRQGHRTEQRDGALLERGAGREAAQPGALDHLVHQRVRRVESRRGALRHVGDPGAAHGLELARRQCAQVEVADPHLPGLDAAAAPRMPEQRQRDRGLAGARLADQGQHLAARDRERQVVHQRGCAARRRGVGDDPQALHLHEGVHLSHVPRDRRRPAASRSAG